MKRQLTKILLLIVLTTSAIAEEVEFETPLYDALLSAIQTVLSAVGQQQLDPALADLILKGEIALQSARLTDGLRTQAQILADLETGGGATAADPAEFLLAGDEAEIPEPGAAGRIYFAGDTGQVLRDTGEAWVSRGYMFASPAGGGEMPVGGGSVTVTGTPVPLAGESTPATWVFVVCDGGNEGSCYADGIEMMPGQWFYYRPVAGNTYNLTGIEVATDNSGDELTFSFAGVPE
jgi:hypothetical protein